MCPLCQAPVPENPRYPRAVCEACVASATDLSGRPVRFFNASLSGGLVVDPPGREYPEFECLVRGKRCIARERYLGGVVVLSYP
jgi:hypothetical protein